jgi:hypothetical protein
MKNGELIALGLAAVAVYMIWKSQAGKGAGTAAVADWTKEIFDLGGGSFGNGWRYFDNGTAIDPSGNYYLNGQMVYQAPGAGA